MVKKLPKQNKKGTEIFLYIFYFQYQNKFEAKKNENENENPAKNYIGPVIVNFHCPTNWIKISYLIVNVCMMYDFNFFW